MPASFREVRSYSGVDENKIDPGMIVPFGGSNLVRLEGGAGLQVTADRKPIQIKEINASSAVGPIVELLILPIRRAFGKNDRFFRISSKVLLGLRGSKLIATDPLTSRASATLRVVVLKQRLIKLSIRPVQVRDAKGAAILHTKVPFDAEALHQKMNIVWTPQANVAFELISHAPAPMLDGGEIATALGLKNQATAELPREVDINVFRGMFVKLKDPKADFTMFLVERVAGGSFGSTLSEDGIAIVGDDRTETTMAHEAGHFVGAHRGPAGWARFGHVGTDQDLLMRDGGSGWKIPFKLTIENFNARY